VFPKSEDQYGQHLVSLSALENEWSKKKNKDCHRLSLLAYKGWVAFIRNKLFCVLDRGKASGGHPLPPAHPTSISLLTSVRD